MLQKTFSKIHFWDLSLERKLDVCGSRERELGRICGVKCIPCFLI